jgi:tripartite-type tricarboxylate transporter receptor subunit TctC
LIADTVLGSEKEGLNFLYAISFISIRTNALLKRPDTRAQLAKAEVEAVGNTPQEFAKFIGSETAKFAALIKHAGIKAE